MKREGRQHGFVGCYYVPPPNLCRRKMVDPATARGCFVKVPNKPTNLSKFTGRCRHPYTGCKCCHITPASKSKDKIKGTMKLRSIDSGNNLTKYYSGTSVTGVLAFLAHENGYNDNDDDDDYDYQGTLEENYDYGYSYGHADHDHDHHDEHHDIDLRVGFGIEEHENDVDMGEIDVDDDDMSFCDVGLCWGHGDDDDDDGWYLVGGQME
ncbi:uncharacterized protein LOC112515080 [Cynara cardunculus var. scolymus]|uniref:Uncharacterized protein n=1 Tax=Cynara cardunculus var. scolymus TaxID=59895 RepID=A0A103XLA7_CYNCS|nr:uncharacterized protein LOC112515080 [Cynara cardunculus var. scolymus]KVH92821.1 hypothetical protein Ccrd_005121 [Cynara cardunculus var. scolymus]